MFISWLRREAGQFYPTDSVAAIVILLSTRGTADSDFGIVVVPAFSLVVLGLEGWRGDWVLVYMEGMMGVLGLARVSRG